MDLLFIHQAYPAQFGRLAFELNRRYGWRCRFLIDHLSRCPTPTQEMLASAEIRTLPGREARTGAGPAPWPQVFGRWLEMCAAVRQGWEEWPGPSPDLVVSHGGQGAPTLFLPEVFGGPIINYCEYYFPDRFADLTYRVDLQAPEIAPFYPRAINAPTLAALSACRSGYSATHYQRDSFPRRYRDRIEVHFDGIDTELYRPGRNPERRVGEHVIPPSTRVVTFVARGLESIRGFDLFARMAAHVAWEQPNTLFVVAGDDTTYYGWDNHHICNRPFRQWAMERSGVDPGRFLFLGHVEPEILADLLSITDVHVYASVPFVVSWSFFNSLASGAVVIGADNAPVREVIEPGVSGLVWPLFDVEALSEQVLAVLRDPATFAPLGRGARAMIEERYGLDACVPRLRDYFERVASSL